jgi:hypothetical protein
MNDEELTIQRTDLAIRVAHALREAGYEFIQDNQENRIIFEVGHADLPHWTRFVTIVQDLRFDITVNVLKIPDLFRTGDLSKPGVCRLIAALDKLKDIVINIRQSAAEAEARAKHYQDQQEQDFRNVAVPEMVNVQVNTRGEHAGTYRVSFPAGSPMEHLTADQARRLVCFIQELKA